MLEDSPSSPVLPRERRQQELQFLVQRGSVRVAQLAKHFAVAEETIRRDLDLLSSQGLLIRTHGGAMRLRSETHDQPNEVRRATLTSEKKTIASAAAELVEEGDVIALDASTTVLELASQIKNIELTIVTNAIDAARILGERRNIKVILTGGELDEEKVGLTGPLAEESIRRFAYTKAFLSCKAIDPERGLSEASLQHSSIKRWMIHYSQHVYLLADHSKFGVRATTFFGELSDVDMLITDSQTDDDMLETLADAGHKTMVV